MNSGTDGPSVPRRAGDTRVYRGRVATLTLLLGVAAAAAVVAGIVGLTSWLTASGETLADLPAPAADEAAQPGAIVCPTAPTASVQASTLIDCSELFDEKQVTYRGEAIRAVLRRDGHAIVQVNDDQYAEAGPLPERRTHLGGNSGLPVVMPLQAADEITFLGSYRAQGDLLAVTGTFHRASNILGGEPAIHATRVEVVRTGHLIRHAVSPKRVATAVALAVAVAFLFALTRRGGQLAEERETAGP